MRFLLLLTFTASGIYAEKMCYYHPAKATCESVLVGHYVAQTGFIQQWPSMPVAKLDEFILNYLCCKAQEKIGANDRLANPTRCQSLGFDATSINQFLSTGKP